MPRLEARRRDRRDTTREAEMEGGGETKPREDSMSPKPREDGRRAEAREDTRRVEAREDARTAEAREDAKRAKLREAEVCREDAQVAINRFPSPTGSSVSLMGGVRGYQTVHTSTPWRIFPSSKGEHNQ